MQAATGSMKIISRLLLLVPVLHQAAVVRADDEYYSDEYYDDDQEGPSDVWGYLLKEAAKQYGGGIAGSKNDESSQHQQVSTSLDSSSSDSVASAAAASAPSIFNTIQEKLFSTDSSLTSDPVYNWIMGFSALALFFQAFYTPFGKTTITKFTGRRRRRSEVTPSNNSETEIGSG